MSCSKDNNQRAKVIELDTLIETAVSASDDGSYNLAMVLSGNDYTVKLSIKSDDMTLKISSNKDEASA